MKKNLLEATQTLSSSLMDEELKTFFDLLIEHVEYDLDVNVEFIDGDNSYWVPTPLDEIEELELFGIIEIGDDQPMIQKIISLAHEAGHAIYSEGTVFSKKTTALLEESLAWYLGYNYFLTRGYEINLSEYEDAINHSLTLYAKLEVR